MEPGRSLSFLAIVACRPRRYELKSMSVSIRHTVQGQMLKYVYLRLDCSVSRKGSSGICSSNLTRAMSSNKAGLYIVVSEEIYQCHLDDGSQRLCELALVDA